MAVPTLSISKLNGTDVEREQFARDLLEGLSGPGFVKLVDHGFSAEDLDGVFKWV